MLPAYNLSYKPQERRDKRQKTRDQQPKTTRASATACAVAPHGSPNLCIYTLNLNLNDVGGPRMKEEGEPIKLFGNKTGIDGT